MTALPPGISVGDRITAPVTPPRTFRRGTVVVTGRVHAVAAHHVTVVSSTGYHTVRYVDARRLA
jgi:hypothetical protein